MSTAVEKEIAQAIFGKQDYRPHVKFYDHAVKDEVATKASGRPRYKHQLNVLIKPTHPDLVVRDTVSRIATDKHKAEFAPEYQKYIEQKAREDVEFRTPLQGVPGMNVVAFNELRDLNITDTLELAEYEGPLDELEHLRVAAKKIMEVARATKSEFEESKRIRAERETVRAVPSRPEYTGGAGITQIPSNQKEGNETFSYSFQVS